MKANIKASEKRVNYKLMYILKICGIDKIINLFHGIGREKNVSKGNLQKDVR